MNKLLLASVSHFAWVISQLGECHMQALSVNGNIYSQLGHSTASINLEYYEIFEVFM